MFFQEELETAEGSLLAEGRLVRTQLEKVLQALASRDENLAEKVVAEDDRVDDQYLATQTRVLNLLALQAPVAGDLRLVSAILLSNMHVERMGDLCVNVAKFVLAGHPYPEDSPMLLRLQEMGDRAKEMLDVALDALSQRSADLAEQLPVMDDRLDRLNRGILDDLRLHAGEEDSFEWAVNLILVGRYLERFGDHAVDIGEQVAFLETGVFREFTDASHPDAHLRTGTTDPSPDQAPVDR